MAIMNTSHLKEIQRCNWNEILLAYKGNAQWYQKFHCFNKKLERKVLSGDIKHTVYKIMYGHALNIDITIWETGEKYIRINKYVFY